MNTTQYQRPAAERLHAATMGGHNLQGKPAGWTPPNAHGIPHPDRPLAHLDAIQHQALFNALLEDWDNPVFTELGLCRAHDISLDQLIAMAELPTFQRALDMIRRVRAMRRPAIEAAAANTILERLVYITQCPLDSASAMKECRLAIKQIHVILNPAPPPAPAPQIAPNASEGMVPQSPTITTDPTTPAHPSSERGGAGDPSPASATSQPVHPPAHIETPTPVQIAPSADAPRPLDRRLQ
jgi:hypothetical protein